MDQSSPTFSAKLNDINCINRLLHYVDDFSILTISQDGILITTGESNFQVSANLPASTFQRFELDDQEFGQLSFRFMLNDFIECLNLLRRDLASGDEDSAQTSLEIEYKKRGSPLRLRLQNQSNCVINCDLKAFNMPGDSRFTPLKFRDGEDIAVILLNSKKFYDYVSGLDLVSSDHVHLVMGRGETPIRLSTNSSSLGEVELEIPQNESDIIKREIIVSDNCLFSFSYKTQFMKPALEALKSSSLVQIKCGSSGLLCIEHFHPSDKFKRDGPFLRPDNTYMVTQTTLSDIISENMQPQDKKSSIEYFILSEAKPIEVCPD